ncbi:MAG: glycosyltransferase [Synechococcaceae cyanobacterium]|nr:glycosyltransferase [Synechococcaceae cyanobacterium]
MIQLLRQMLDEALPQLFEACRGADLLLATPQQLLLATLVAEGLSLPLQPVSVTPSLHGVELSEEALARAAAASSQSSAPIEQLLVRARIRLGLAANDSPTQQPSCRERLLLGSSSHFCRAVGEDVDAVQTGFWFHDDPRFAAWQPERELRAFMEQDPAPLVLSFSSQPLADARAIVAVHAQAAAWLGRPLLIQQGWAGFRREHLPLDCDPAAIRFEGFLPQDWLFAQASALIHHGGIGTTARALRNDCPMLVEPFGNDQFFNARQIVGLGLGAAMHPEQLRPEAVAEVLQRRVLTQETHARVGALGALLRAENGLEAAVAHVETRLCS